MIDLEMLKYNDCINSAKSGMMIQEAVNKKRIEEQRQKGLVEKVATKAANIQQILLTGLEEARVNSRKSARLSMWTLIVTSILGVISIIIAIAK